MDWRDLTQALRSLIDFPLLRLGGVTVSVRAVVHVLLFAALVFYLAVLLRRALGRLLKRTRLDESARQATASVAQYFVVLVGLLVVLQTAGIDVTTFNVIAGAIGLGVGIGMQTIAANFFSGLILMVERPVKVGDRIDVGGVEGDVVRIGVRSTVVLANDGIAIIIPNSRLIVENVINWSHTGETVRFSVPVTVAYDSDPAVVEEALLAAAAACADVLSEPSPSVRLTELGDHGLRFELRAWSSTLMHRKGVLTSHLNMAVYRALRERHIEIPYPQRVIRIHGAQGVATQ